MPRNEEQTFDFGTYTNFLLVGFGSLGSFDECDHLQLPAPMIQLHSTGPFQSIGWKVSKGGCRPTKPPHWLVWAGGRLSKWHNW